MDPARIVECFDRYTAGSGTPISRAEFEANLLSKVRDPSFVDDSVPLLATGARGVNGSVYEPARVGELVMTQLVSRLPGASWKRDKVE